MIRSQPNYFDVGLYVDLDVDLDSVLDFLFESEQN